MSSTAPTSAFDASGPSRINLGRVKSVAQTKKDAQRVNQYSDVGRNSPTQSDRTNEITGRRLSARWQ